MVGVFSDNMVGVSEISKILEVLDDILKELALRGTGISSLSGTHRCMRKLVKLDLSHNQIVNEGAEYLARVLKGNENLLSLVLGDNGISDLGAAAIGEALEGNKRLSFLDFSGNKITTVGVQSFSKMLSKNKTLRTLKLNRCFTGTTARSFAVFAEAIMMNKSLVCLQLSYICLEYDAAKAISRALETNKTLKRLDFFGNPISAEGARSFSELLVTNKQLESLCFKEYNIFETNPILVEIQQIQEAVNAKLYERKTQSK